jgi:arylformamidase
MTNTSHWRNLSPAEREREYSPSSCIGGNYQPFIAAYKAESKIAVEKTKHLGGVWSQHRYGSKASQKMHLCLPTRLNQVQNALPPLLVFIHGGYWQELSAADSLFAAQGCVLHDAAFAALDYTLAPNAAVAQMVDECCAALAYLSQNAGLLGVDAGRIVVAGSSAGAHLTAMVAQCSLQHSYRLHGAVLVSGIYELEPLISTTINDALALNAESALAISPALLSAKDFPNTIVCYGEIETTEFKRQSQQFAQQIRRESDVNAGLVAFEVPERNHFDVIMDLTNGLTALGQATLNLLNTPPHTSHF